MSLWINSTDALADWLARHPTPAAAGLDTEFMRTNTFKARLALVQLKIGNEIALIDNVAIADATPLVRRLGDPRNLTIMHSAGEDLEAMTAILPDGPADLFDTQIAAALAGIGFGLSYQKLVALVLGVEIAKSETRSDWLQRPLTAAQLEYAAHDVAWLPQLHAHLATRLEDLGRADWLRQECRTLIERACRATPELQPQRALRGAAGWPLEQQALLRRLLLWRDARARELDKPKPWLLDDAHALQLAAQPPRDGETLFERTRGLRALRGAQRQELLALLLQPLSAEDLAIEPMPPALDGAQKRALGEMKDAVGMIAAELVLPEALLCARRHLETLLLERRWPEALEGWRKPLLFDRLTGLVPR